MKVKSNPELKEVRRKLRQSMTPAEHLLWARLRNNQLGYRFLRQYSLRYYIVDFYCPKLRIAIEIDGAHHQEDEVKEYDQERDTYLKNLRITIIRFQNTEILKSIDTVIPKLISAFPSTEGKVGKGF